MARNLSDKMLKTKPGSQNGSGTRPRVSQFHGLAQDDDPLIGVTVGEKYEIIAKIGSGAAGEVYLADDKSTGTQVAVKMTGKNTDKRYAMVERFFVEVRAVMMINHPNVIKMLDAGAYKDRLYCVMEYLDGRDLSQVLKGGPLEWKRTLSIMAQVCEALGAAHAEPIKIMHRDLKPANVYLVDTEGPDFVKVLDFGFAKFSDEKLTQ